MVPEFAGQPPFLVALLTRREAVLPRAGRRPVAWVAGQTSLLPPWETVVSGPP